MSHFTAYLRKGATHIALRPFRANGHGRKVILCFHSIKPFANHSHIPPAGFEKILRWLNANCDVMGVRDLIKTDRSNHERPAVALTFDDGHLDNHTFAMPVAIDCGVRFSFYVTVGLVERDPDALKRFPYVLRQKHAEFEALSWNEIGEMIAAGFSVGSHTWDHPMLSQLSDGGIAFQLEYSKEVLSKRTGCDNFGICYPYGKYNRNIDKRVCDQAKKSGYAYGLAVCHHSVSDSDDLFSLPRFIINSANLNRLESIVRGEYDGHGIISKKMPRFVARKLSPTDFSEAYGAPPPRESL